MQHKNIFLLLALSGSVLMVMLVSTLLFIPHTASLQANITGDFTSKNNHEVTTDLNSEPKEIMQTIQKYVENNDPDAAKRLYEELYINRNKRDSQSMGGEVSSGVHVALGD